MKIIFFILLRMNIIFCYFLPLENRPLFNVEWENAKSYILCHEQTDALNPSIHLEYMLRS